jgi:ribosomal protein S12 methylthiotransferase accessory factor
MEAIEFAMAEPCSARVNVAMGTNRDLLESDERGDAILDFCPIVGKQIDLSASLACVAAEELMTGRMTLVPAELVLLPYVGRSGTGLFGSQSNGLCSGNTVMEATLHGLFEVIERDVRSFHYVFDRAKRVNLASLPEVAKEQLQSMQSAGLECCVRVLPNSFGIPVFEAMVMDPFAPAWRFTNGGYGCHLVSEIALIRAITEAAQSRLSWIHGGRDDLEAPRLRNDAIPESILAKAAAVEFHRVSHRTEATDYDQIPDAADESRTVDDALGNTMKRLRDCGIRKVCRVALTIADEPLQVLRIIVPKLEHMEPHSSHRCGRRLHEFASQHAT